MKYQKKIADNKPIVTPKLLLILSLIVVGGIVIALTVNRASNKTNNQAGYSVKETEPAMQATIALPQASYRYGDKISFEATIRNNSDSAKTYSFDSACTQGILSVDNMPTQATQVCADAITEVTVAAGKTVTHMFDFVVVRDFSPDARALVDGDYIEIEGELKLAPGKHTATLKWQDLTSNKLTFNISE